MDDAIHPLSDVAVACDGEVGTIRSHQQRGHLRLGEGDAPSSIAGKAHRVSLRRALQIAIALKLIGLGLEPPAAYAAALRFTDGGKGGTGWVGDPISPAEMAADLRSPGELFAEGETWMLVAGGHAHVVNVTEGRGWDETLRQLAPNAFRALCLDEIVMTVTARLETMARARGAKVREEA